MKPPESLAAALQRVRLFMNPRGSRASSNNNPAAAAAAQQQQHQPPAAAAAAAQDDDAEVISDGDDDIVVGNRVVSLKDPNTFMRINQPARFTDTCGNDLLAFDLDTFLDMADTTLKWIDPHSMKASCVQNLQVRVPCVCAVSDACDACTAVVMWEWRGATGGCRGACFKGMQALLFCMLQNAGLF